jgi:tetratricopeptide (TPR) repeat protein
MNSTEALKNAARDAEQSGNWQRAADLYEQLLRLGGLDSWDHIWRARALLFAGHTADAATLIESLPAVGDEKATVIGLQADLRERLGQYEEARKLWVRACEAGFSAYWCLFGEARACFFGKARTSAKRQFDEAQELMAQALSHPDLSQDRNRYGMTFAAMLEKAKTKVESEQLIRFDATVVAGPDKITGRETRTLVGANFTGEITDWPAMQIGKWLESFYGSRWQVQALLTLSLVDLREAIRHHDCHLLMLHVPKEILRIPPPLSLDGIIRMPTLELTARVTSIEDLLRHSKTLRKEVRKLASRGYGYSIGGKQDWPGFVAMHRAFVRTRHGRIGLDEFQDQDSDMMRYFDDGNILEREFRLLKIEKDGDWVAAVLLNINDVIGKYVPTCSGISRRIPPGAGFMGMKLEADRLARAGVLWFSVAYLLKCGKHEIYLSDAVPWTSSGLLIFKSKYNPEVVPSPFDLCLGFRTKGVGPQLREWLINNPVFTRENPAGLIINLHPQAPEVVARSCGDVCERMANRPQIITRDLLRHCDLSCL